MAGVEKRSFDSPDESRTPEKTQVDIVNVAGTKAARFRFEPGWTWDGCLKPVVGGESCQHRHVGLVRSGTLRLTHDDGTVEDLSRGDVYVIEPGHTAEVVGDEPWEAFEFESNTAAGFARG